MNRVTLAVAGARKTQSVVEECAGADHELSQLVLTYTLSAQADVQRRLQRACSTALPEVMGWYAFLLNHVIRPYLPLLYPDRRLRGLNFEGQPPRGRYATGEARYLDSESRAFKLHLSKLAIDVLNASKGAALDRLQRIYNRIFIDEVQDLTGYDLDVLDSLLKSRIEMRLVGDVRQSLYDTNPRDPRHRKYRGLKMVDWFGEKEKRGLIAIHDTTETWRSVQEIATFSDGIFRDELAFPSTISRQTAISEHMGVFAVASHHVTEYIATYEPTCLRPTKAVAVPEGVVAINFGVSKGATYNRVLIFSTEPIRKFLRRDVKLADKSASGLYVAVTRAVLSVAIVSDMPQESGLKVWTPSKGLFRNGNAAD